MTIGDKLFANSTFQKQVFDRSEAATIVLNSSGMIILSNKRLAQITGYSSTDLEENKNWRDIILKEEHDDFSGYLQLLKINAAEIPQRLEIKFKDKEENIRTGFLSGFIIPEENLTVLSLVDISEQKEYELNLEKAKEEAETSERLKTSFLANMSHEIRTPINSIVGFADLLKLDELSQAKKNLYIDQVIYGSHDLLLLIEKIIIISRLDSGQLKINNREFNLNGKMSELEEKFKEELINRGKEDIELRFVPGNKEKVFIIHADPIRLMDVLFNLLENSIKFTDSGRIEFGYYSLENDSLESNEDSILFYVKDSGSGIEKANKKVIFDRFVKIIDNEETIHKGAGLGLSICKEIVALFGGNLWVESTKGSGSRFFFNYPLGKNQVDIRKDPKENKNSKSALDWSDKMILIAEDIESNYLYIKELIYPTKVKILRARDGIEAVSLFESHPEIDLVIMDILMPGMDGHEATIAIRKIKADIPVIAQSAFTFEGDMQNGLYSGCFNDYIMKPYSRKILLAVINKYFSEK